MLPSIVPATPQYRPHPHDHLYKTMVELGGGVYRGIQPGDASIKLSALVLFDGPRKSTLALKCDDVSAEAVRAHIAENERLWLEAQARREREMERCATLAVDRIFHYFGQGPVKLTQPQLRVAA